jgi:hypothetical protein
MVIKKEIDALPKQVENVHSAEYTKVPKTFFASHGDIR